MYDDDIFVTLEGNKDAAAATLATNSKNEQDAATLGKCLVMCVAPRNRFQKTNL